MSYCGAPLNLPGGFKLCAFMVQIGLVLSNKRLNGGLKNFLSLFGDWIRCEASHGAVAQKGRDECGAATEPAHREGESSVHHFSAQFADSTCCLSMWC